VFDDEFKIATFQTLTVEDITGVGRIKPIAARHFAEQAQIVQNLGGLMNSAGWQAVSPHFSTIKLAKIYEDFFGLKDYEIVTPYVALAEQADAQRIAQTLQAQVTQEAATATGRGEDFDQLPTQSEMQPTPQAPGPQGP
jgi:hypothetical protein